MKVRTSISVTDSLLKQIDKLPNRPARSEIIEEALMFYFKNLLHKHRNDRDRELLDAHADELNEEAQDVLTYQKKLKHE